MKTQIARVRHYEKRALEADEAAIGTHPEAHRWLTLAAQSFRTQALRISENSRQMALKGGLGQCRSTTQSGVT